MAVITPRLDPFGRPIAPSPTYPVAAPVVNQAPIEEPVASPADNYDVSRRMRELYTPEMESTELFNKILGQYPQRTQPSLIREIGSSLTGLGPGGYDLAVKAREEPFRNKLEDWKNLMEPAQQAMVNERLANVNLRTLANQIVSQELADKRLERAVARDKVLEAQGAKRLEQSDERIKIARAQARGGTPQWDPSTGTMKIVFKDGSTIPVDIHRLTQEELLELQQQYALERIQETGKTKAAGKPRVSKEYRLNPETGKIELGVLNLDTGEFKPATEGTEKVPVTPGIKGEAEQTRKIDSNALRVKNSNARWSKWIEMKNGKFVRIKPPSLGGLIGPSQEEYNAIARAIGIVPPTTVAPAAPSNVPPKKTGQIRVRHIPTGRTGSWDTSKGPIPKDFEQIPEGAK